MDRRLELIRFVELGAFCTNGSFLRLEVALEKTKSDKQAIIATRRLVRRRGVIGVLHEVFLLGPASPRLNKGETREAYQ